MAYPPNHTYIVDHPDPPTVYSRNLVFDTMTLSWVAQTETSVATDVNVVNTVDVNIVSGSFSVSTNASGAPSQEHTLANNPTAVRLTDGSSFYIATQQTQLPSSLTGLGNLKVSIAEATSALYVLQDQVWSVVNVASTVAISGTVLTSATGTPSQEHTLADNPNSTRLSDGSAFYTAPSSSQFPVSLTGAGNLKIAIEESAITLANTVTGAPSQEHTTAANPSSVRLTDGTTFYKPTTPADTQPISGTVGISGVVSTTSATGSPAQEHTLSNNPVSSQLSDGTSFYTAPSSNQLPAALSGSGNLKVDILESIALTVEQDKPWTVVNTASTVNIAGTVSISQLPSSLTDSGNLKVAIVEDSLLAVTVVATGVPAQEHTLANNPVSVELSDGAAFYVAAKSSQLPSALTGSGNLKIAIAEDLTPITVINIASSVNIVNSPTVSVINSPTVEQDKPWTVINIASSVLVTNFPAVQTIAGTVQQDKPWTVVNTASTVSISGTVAVTGTFTSTSTGAPAQEHTLATNPVSVELSDGSAFYVAAKSSQLPSSLSGAGNLKVDIAESAAITVLQDTPWTVVNIASSINVTQFGGTNISTGTGTSGAGIPRVTVSSDSFPATQAVSGTVSIGNAPTVEQDKPWTVVNTASTVSITGVVSVSGTLTSTATGAPAQEHTLATNPVSVELSDGAAFYVGAKSSQLPSALTGSGNLKIAIAEDTAAVTVLQDRTWTVSNVASSVTISGSVTTSPPANASTNITQFGGNAVVTGTGVSGAGIPRVTVSSDSFPATQAVTQSGTWTVQPGNTANTTPWLSTINQGGNSATVTAANALKVDGSAVTQPVSIAGSVTVSQATASNLNATVVQTTASNLNAQVQGPTGSGTAKSGNPIQIGGVFNTTQPTIATGQMVEAQFTARGAHIVAVGVDGFNVGQTGTWTVQQVASVIPGSTTMQNAAAANGNGTNLSISGYATVVLHITTASGVGTINFEVSVDNVTWVSVLGTLMGATTTGISTSSAGDWQFNVAGFSFMRSRISGYVSGTFTVVGYAAVVAGAGLGSLSTSPPSNASTNVSQFGGTNISTGTGTSGAGIPRVTVSNDSNVLSTLIDSAGTNKAQIQGNGALRVICTPDNPGTLGWYAIAQETGNLSGIAANATVWSMRYGGGNLALIKRVTAYLILTTTFTTNQELNFALFLARSFTASDSGGTAATLTGNNCKLRTSYATTGMSDIRISNATALTAGTRTPDSAPISAMGGWTFSVGGSQITIAQRKSILFDHGAAGHPIILAQNEGIIIENGIAMGAAGVVKFAIDVEWAEVSAY